MQRLMIRKPEVYERMREASFTPGAGMALLVALGIYFVYFILREIPANIIDFIYYSGKTARDQMEAEKIVHDYITAPGTMLASLALTTMFIAVTLFYVRKIEKRPLRATGLGRPCLKRFAIGYAAGLAFFLLAAFPEFIAGTVRYKAADSVALLFILAYIVQAVSEEIFFRGYLLSTLTARTGAVPAILISSALFAGLRVWNHSASGLMILELFLSGALYAFTTLRTGSIWAAAGMHAAQSFTYGLVSPVAMSELKTDYSMLSLQPGEGAGDIFPLIYTAVCAVTIVFVLFAGKNRLAVPLNNERRMYLKAVQTVKDVLRSVRGEDGVPFKRLGFSIAGALHSDEAKASALLYAVRLGGREFTDESYSADVLETVAALVSGKGVSKNQTALEIRYAAEKSRAILKGRYRKHARQPCQIFCPLLRRETDETVCAEIMASVDAGDREGLYAMMDLNVCLKCLRR